MFCVTPPTGCLVAALAAQLATSDDRLSALLAEAREQKTPAGLAPRALMPVTWLHRPTGGKRFSTAPGEGRSDSSHSIGTGIRLVFRKEPLKNPPFLAVLGRYASPT